MASESVWPAVQIAAADSRANRSGRSRVRSGKRFPKIRILISLGQKLGERLDRNERILDFVCHAGRERAEAGEPVAAANLQFEALDRGDISQHHERAEDLSILPVKN